MSRGPFYFAWGCFRDFVPGPCGAPLKRRAPHPGHQIVRAELNLVGIAMRAERKVIDKIIDGLKFHS